MRGFVLTCAFIFTACGKVDAEVPDAEVPDAEVPDAIPLNGCNGLLNCYLDCNANNPVQTCFDDCDTASTQQALDLLNAFGGCIDQECFQSAGGPPPCDPANPNTPECDQCYANILATSTGSCTPTDAPNCMACHDEQLACVDDRP